MNFLIPQMVGLPVFCLFTRRLVEGFPLKLIAEMKHWFEHHGLKRSESCCKKPWPLWDQLVVRTYIYMNVYIYIDFKGDIQAAGRSWEIYIYIYDASFFLWPNYNLTITWGRSSCCVAGDLGTCTGGRSRRVLRDRDKNNIHIYFAIGSVPIV